MICVVPVKSIDYGSHPHPHPQLNPTRAPDGPAHGSRWADIVLKIILRYNELTQFFHDVLRGEWSVFP